MSQLTQDIKDKVEKKINECIAVIEKKYKVTFRAPKITYDVRGTTAGKAYYREWRVAFNPVLLVENVDAFLKRTCPHEIAHLATELIYPHAHRAGFGRKRSPHGAEWASIMTALGADASRCHTYDVTNAKVKRTTTYAYKCSCCGHKFELGPKRHAKLLSGTNFWHPACGKVAGKLVRDMPAATVQIVQPAKTVSKPVKVTVPAGETKLARCYRLFENYPGYSRAEMINVFVQECDMTVAGASTYYAKVKQMAGR